MNDLDGYTLAEQTAVCNAAGLLKAFLDENGYRNSVPSEFEDTLSWSIYLVLRIVQGDWMTECLIELMEGGDVLREIQAVINND